MYVTGPQLDSIDAYIKGGNYAAAAPIMIAGDMTTNDLKGLWPVSAAAITALHNLGVKASNSFVFTAAPAPAPAPAPVAAPVAPTAASDALKPFIRGLTYQIGPQAGPGGDWYTYTQDSWDSGFDPPRISHVFGPLDPTVNKRPTYTPAGEYLGFHTESSLFSDIVKFGALALAVTGVGNLLTTGSLFGGAGVAAVGGEAAAGAAGTGAAAGSGASASTALGAGAVATGGAAAAGGAATGAGALAGVGGILKTVAGVGSAIVGAISGGAAGAAPGTVPVTTLAPGVPGAAAPGTTAANNQTAVLAVLGAIAAAIVFKA